MYRNLTNFQIFLSEIMISGKCYGLSNQNMTFCYETGHRFHT